MTEAAAVLQLAQVEFADADLVVVPSEATIEIELRNVREPQIRAAAGQWKAGLATNHAG